MTFVFVLKWGCGHGSFKISSRDPFMWQIICWRQRGQGVLSWEHRPPTGCSGSRKFREREETSWLWCFGCGWSCLHLLNQIISCGAANQVIGDQQSGCMRWIKDTLCPDPFKGVPTLQYKIDLLKQWKKYSLFKIKTDMSVSKFLATVQQAVKRW